jgi:hypothetical protein
MALSAGRGWLGRDCRKKVGIGLHDAKGVVWRCERAGVEYREQRHERLSKGFPKPMLFI